MHSNVKVPTFQLKQIIGKTGFAKFVRNEIYSAQNTHRVHINRGEEGRAGGQIVQPELGRHLSSDQQVGQVEGQGRLVPVLRHHQVSHLVVDADDEPAPYLHTFKQPLHRDE